LSFDINFYETSKAHVIKRAFAKLARVILITCTRMSTHILFCNKTQEQMFYFLNIWFILSHDF